MLSTPMKSATLKKAALDYRPSLNADGRVFADVLSHCDGSATVETIVQSLCDRYPERYHAPAEALSFVQGIIKRHG